MGGSSLRGTDANWTVTNGRGAAADDQRAPDQMDGARRLDRSAALFDALCQLQRARRRRRKIDISVVTFPGDGGSDADNINRWRGQMGLAPIDANAVTSQIAPLKTGDMTFSTTDIAGNKTRTIAAWTRQEGRVWFFKATGPSAAIEKEKPNFVKFIESVRF